MKADQNQVNKTLTYIKEKYPHASCAGLTQCMKGKSDTPLYYSDNVDFLDQVNRSQIWIQYVVHHFGILKKVNIRKGTSYTIKHMIEKSEMSKGYVSNMAAIVALIIEGVEISNHMNPYTNLSQKIYSSRGIENLKLNDKAII